MARLKPWGNNPDKENDKDYIWCAEFEHDTVDTSNQRMVKSRSYTPWFAERGEIVDFLANCGGVAKKIYRRRGGEIQIATARAWMKLWEVNELIDNGELSQSSVEAWSAEDLTLG